MREEAGQPRWYATVPCAVGDLLVVGSSRGVHEILFPDAGGVHPVPDDAQHAPEHLADALVQLREYLAGERRHFELPLAPHGTAFQRAVWSELTRIPYGRTVSYVHVASRLGRPNAARAVGGAVGRNPLTIVVPCHRVVGADGTLTGYGGGLHRKRFLLGLEGVEVPDDD